MPVRIRTAWGQPAARVTGGLRATLEPDSFMNFLSFSGRFASAAGSAAAKRAVRAGNNCAGCARRQNVIFKSTHEPCDFQVSAVAFRAAVEAGHQARLAGRIPRRYLALASSPVEGMADL